MPNDTYALAPGARTRQICTAALQKAIEFGEKVMNADIIYADVDEIENFLAAMDAALLELKRAEFAR